MPYAELHEETCPFTLPQAWSTSEQRAVGGDTTIDETGGVVIGKVVKPSQLLCQAVSIG